MVEISDDMREDQDEKVQLSPWLFGKKGEPSRQDISHVIEGNALLREKRDDLGKSNIPIYGAAFIDWYSFMGGVSKYLKNQYINSGKTPVVNRISDVEVISEETYIYVNDDMRYWIGVGPEVAYYNYHIDYPGEAATVGEEQFKLGSEIDVVLRNKEEPGSSLVYIECILGMLKAHTYAEDYVNGVFQTGKAYPYSAQANENGDAHRDGSYVEFLRVKEGENEKFPDEKNWRMSDYVVEKIIVYKRGW